VTRLFDGDFELRSEEAGVEAGVVVVCVLGEETEDISFATVAGDVDIVEIVGFRKREELRRI
jgi:hypothetical protein